jgi:hypothetical protein
LRISDFRLRIGFRDSLSIENPQSAIRNPQSKGLRRSMVMLQHHRRRQPDSNHATTCERACVAVNGVYSARLSARKHCSVDGFALQVIKF